jgi:hypothetical protein
MSAERLIWTEKIEISKHEKNRWMKNRNTRIYTDFRVSGVHENATHEKPVKKNVKRKIFWKTFFKKSRKRKHSIRKLFFNNLKKRKTLSLLIVFSPVWRVRQRRHYYLFKKDSSEFFEMGYWRWDTWTWNTSLTGNESLWDLSCRRLLFCRLLVSCLSCRLLLFCSADILCPGAYVSSYVCNDNRNSSFICLIVGVLAPL